MYRGTVTRATVAGVWARVPGLAPGAEFGPLQSCVTAAVGDDVLLADLGSTSLPDLVVVGVLS